MACIKLIQMIRILSAVQQPSRALPFSNLGGPTLQNLISVILRHRVVLPCNNIILLIFKIMSKEAVPTNVVTRRLVSYPDLTMPPGERRQSGKVWV